MNTESIDELCINTIRFLAVDAVEKAKSGHPGTPMGAAPFGWEHYVGLDGVVMGVSRFGASAPGTVIYEKLGLIAQQVVDEAQRLLQRRKA